jgi:hypothetical protein
MQQFLVRIIRDEILQRNYHLFNLMLFGLDPLLDLLVTGTKELVQLRICNIFNTINKIAGAHCFRKIYYRYKFLIATRVYS